MRRLMFGLLLLLMASLSTGMDCWGGVYECYPPEGLVLGEGQYYCEEGERGYCRVGGHPGDTVWEDALCPEGSECAMVDGLGTCLMPDGTVAPEPE